MARTLTGSLVILALAGVAAGCGSVDPEMLPPAPSMIAFSGDPFVETGIRPDPEAGDATSPESGGILVEWREPTSEELGAVLVGAYNLYRSDSAGADGKPVGFERIASIAETPVGNDTSFSDTAVAPNVRYWYAVRAATRSSGAEGALSEPVSFTLTQRPVAVAPIGELDSADAAQLRFRYGPPILGGDVAIHLYRVQPNNERVIIDTVWRSLARGTFADPTVEYAGPALVSGAHYRWRIDKITSHQPIGNASSWVTFVAP
jgi:hypothetical protein